MNIQKMLEQIIIFLRSDSSEGSAPDGPDEPDEPTINEQASSVIGLGPSFEQERHPSVAKVDLEESVRERVRGEHGPSQIPADVRPIFILSLRERALLYKLSAAQQWARGEREQALKLWRAYCELYPDALQPNHALGEALIACNQHEQAFAAFERAVTSGERAGSTWGVESADTKRWVEVDAPVFISKED